jgi:hypothetical protein
MITKSKDYSQALTLPLATSKSNMAMIGSKD